MDNFERVEDCPVFCVGDVKFLLAYQLMVTHLSRPCP